MSAQEATPTDYDVGSEMSLLPQAVDRKGRAAATWVLKAPKERSFWEWVVSLDLCPPEVYFEKPADFDRGPPPVHPIWRENLFVLSYGMIPIALQATWYHLFPGSTWNPWAAYFVYLFHFVSFAYVNVGRLHFYMQKYGVFDEKNRGRDLISDAKKDHLAFGIVAYMFLRIGAPFILAYDRAQAPRFEWYAPVQVLSWLVALDFFFYAYHRSCHEVPWLWHVHRAHHGTKHPTPILSILADDYQEVIEVIIVPLCATAIVPMSFHTGYMALVYLLYVEMLGHSGIRAYWPHPLLGPILAPLDLELAIEDHDQHHRLGRARGRNYGKQTRIFDKLLGTSFDRVETKGIGGYASWWGKRTSSPEPAKVVQVTKKTAIVAEAQQ